MPRRNKKSNKNRNVRRKKMPRRKPAASGLGSLIAKGVRTLTAYLPGQTIVRPAVNYILRTLGFASFYLINNNIYVENAKFSGASSCITITACDLFCEMKSSGCATVADVSCVNAPSVTKKVQCTQLNYRGIMIDNVSFKLCPTGPLGEREGMWAMCFQSNVSDDRSGFNDDAFKQHPPTFENLRQMPGAVSGPATKCLSLKWRPTVRKDGLAALGYDFYDKTHNVVGWLFIAYENFNRAAGDKDFTPAQLGNEILINASGRLREREMASTTSAGSIIVSPRIYDTSNIKDMYFVTDGKYGVWTARDHSGRLRVEPESPNYESILNELSMCQ